MVWIGVFPEWEAVAAEDKVGINGVATEELDDAGVEDARVEDAGVEDAGVEDAGVEDAGQTVVVDLPGRENAGPMLAATNMAQKAES